MFVLYKLSKSLAVHNIAPFKGIIIMLLCTYGNYACMYMYMCMCVGFIITPSCATLLHVKVVHVHV